jgi:AcrR family transcriptional regulator
VADARKAPRTDESPRRVPVTAPAEQLYSVTLDDLAPAARLREIALRLFGELGIAGTSIRTVAAAAGVSPSAVLHHFKSKEDLERAVLDSVLQRISTAISGVGLDMSPLSALHARRAAFDSFSAANPAIMAYVHRVYYDGGPASAQVFHAINDLRTDQMADMVAAGLARPMPDPEVGTLMYAVLWLAPLLLRPLLEETGNLDLDDPAVLARFRAAEIDLLTHPLFLTATIAKASSKKGAS